MESQMVNEEKKGSLEHIYKCKYQTSHHQHDKIKNPIWKDCVPDLCCCVVILLHTVCEPKEPPNFNQHKLSITVVSHISYFSLLFCTEIWIWKKGNTKLKLFKWEKEIWLSIRQQCKSEYGASLPVHLTL